MNNIVINTSMSLQGLKDITRHREHPELLVKVVTKIKEEIDAIKIFYDTIKPRLYKGPGIDRNKLPLTKTQELINKLIQAGIADPRAAYRHYYMSAGNSAISYEQWMQQEFTKIKAPSTPGVRMPIESRWR